MVSPTVLSYFVGIWASIYLVDAGLRTHPYTKQRYSEITSRLGVSVHLLQARLFTQRLNRLFHRICQVEYIPWNAWFSCGAVFSAIFMVLSTCLLSLLAYNTLMKKPIENQVITPVMPGVNLPLNHLGFYMLTLLVCGLLHEAGHALAALRERVRLNGFGIFLFGVYPGAFVDLNSADLQKLSPLCQLRIYCAGVWHNAVIALLSVGVYYALPWILSPGYALGSGVGVTYLQEDSVVTGHRGLSLGDAITRINACPVTNQSDWYQCLLEAHNNPSGYCVSGAYLKTADVSMQVSGLRRSLTAVAVVPPVASENTEGSMTADEKSVHSSETPSSDCCAHQSASTHLCFTYLMPIKHGGKVRHYACLPARAVTERASCKLSSDCGPIGGLWVPPNNIPGAVPGSPTNFTAAVTSARIMACAVPSPPDNSTRLVRLVHNRLKSPAVLFLGPIDDLLSSVGVSDYVPRIASVLPPQLPAVVGLLCMYLFSLSGALVILNVVPCYALDGQWILQALLEICLPGILFGRRFRRALFTIVLMIGSVLLFTNLFLALWYLYLEANAGEASRDGNGNRVTSGAVQHVQPSIMPNIHT